ncbi:type II secretion system F family protein [Streptomyces sp. NPDC102360]|uniref:type II secretion system F family protein n=1 Tax=Streptomyces sp. NPDC102360 TaxID=3366160 RepID=UPI00382DB5CC
MLAAIAVRALPWLLNAETSNRQHAARVEGIAGWTEMLRDTLVAAAGLEQAMMATARTAPQSIRPEVQGLATRLAFGERLSVALRRLANDLADPVADLVIAALMLASENQARQLSPLLDDLAATARSHVEMRQRIEAGRTRVRTTTRVVITTTLSFAGGLMLLNPAFLAPYDSAVGQTVLIVVGAVFAAGFVWLRRLARLEQPERFLTALGPSDAETSRPDLVRREVGP